MVFEPVTIPSDGTAPAGDEAEPAADRFREHP